MAVKVSLIVAHDDQKGIGAKNRLLWNIKKDLAHFRQITLGHPVIMGRKTYDSIGRPLADRTNIIITRQKNLSLPDCFIVDSLEAAITLGKTKDKQELFIIGGGEIYSQAMAKNLVDRLYITHVQGDYKADTFFPSYDHFHTLINQTSDQEDDYQFEYKVWEK